MDEMNVGAYLRSVRESLEISSGEVCRKTHMTRQILEQVEATDHALLPEPVFVRGFVRVYADILGLDPDEVESRYRSDLERYQREMQKGRGRSCFQKRIRMVLVSAILAGLLCVGWAAVRPVESGLGMEMPAPSPRDPAVESDPVAALRLQENRHMTLRMAGITDTSVKLIIDGGKPETYMVRTGEYLYFTALRNFNLLIENARGVELFYNGRNYPVPGGEDQAVNILFP